MATDAMRQKQIELLRERGLVTWTPRVARSIRLVKPA